ncbi:glutamine--tRNA ligase/YqeY domain fusion protein [Lentisphaerota bacterium WC36G]|nr:glutamine--tRNA ligase/YqeY domain fusion protein [Lentisphaerae bacterium WC36]
MNDLENNNVENGLNNFITEIIDNDIANNKNNGAVITRFPPEPNGYLHIGHAQAIWLNFSIAKKFGGKCHLRMDDTNPEKESIEYANAIQEDVKWLGWDWNDDLYFASDYYQQLYNYAIELISSGKAYVCDLSPDEFREYKGTLKEPGRPSPFRNRSVEENLTLFEEMKNGKYADGEKCLRAKIDMEHPNILMRDPAIYRIRRAHHYRTLDKWCIYPIYDFAHPLEDAIENITHSICTLEFEVHRPLYNWFVENTSVKATPQQIEFSRLDLSGTMMSKRKLLQLVEEGVVAGWDDPRMPTVSGLRRRGYTPEAINNFCEKAGITKFKGIIDLSLLEHCVREDLNKHASRYLAVMNPLKVTISNWEEGRVDILEGVNNPEDETAGTREIPFSKHLYIDRNDFMENAPKKFFRLSEGREVRLRYAYYITCDEVIKDENGEVIELICSYDPESRGGKSPDGRRVKGTIHWVSVEHAAKAEVRLYDRLFATERPGTDDAVDFHSELNSESLTVVDAYLEPALANSDVTKTVQFERQGYFCKDKDSTAEKIIFNRTASLRDSWAKKKK